jgi:flagellar biosynthetic protein FlhB
MLVKSAIVALFAYTAIKGIMPLIGGLVPMTATVSIAIDEAQSLLRTVAVVGLVMAAADYAMQRRRIGKQTRMSKEDIKQEHKQQEGDPHVKGHIRARQMAAARSRMMSAVPTADVILTNPTHVAVALKYDPAAGAPKVVAKGAGAVASKIRDKATEASVPLVRDVPLARTLYSSCQVGQEIPAELFAAVAQVLAFVISRKTAGQQGGEHETPRHEPDLPEVPKAGRRRRPTTPA